MLIEARGFYSRKYGILFLIICTLFDSQLIMPLDCGSKQFEATSSCSDYSSDKTVCRDCICISNENSLADDGLAGDASIVCCS